MSDEIRTCVTCGKRYSWNHGEQRFYREHNLAPPKNCPQHRRGRGYVPGSAQPAPQARPRTVTPRRGGWRLPMGPIRVYGLVTFALSALLAAALVSGLRLDGVLAWLVAVNTVTLSTFTYDKAAAMGGRDRVPEAVLLALTVGGGVIGAVAAMLSLRHKTAKGSFQLRMWLAAAPPASLMLLYVFTVLR